MQDNNIKMRRVCQVPFDELEGEVLTDIARNGKERPWRRKKVMNMTLADAYDVFNPSKASRLRDCAKFLQFRHYLDGTIKLHSMSSCRVRLCPMCAWRRSLKTYYNNLKIVRYLQGNKQYQYLFVTLTVRNCRAHDLNATLDELSKAVNRFNKRPEIMAAFKGTCRCLEITHNVDKSSEWYDTFHPHYHLICAVNPSYFKSAAYLSQAKLTEIWRSCCALDYTPVCHIERFYGTLEKAVAESSKYSTKDTEYIIPEDWDFTVKTVQILDEALHGRRLINYTGVMKQARAILKLEDEETGSLVDVGDTEASDLPYEIVTYYFYSGYKQYLSITT